MAHDFGDVGLLFSILFCPGLQTWPKQTANLDPPPPLLKKKVEHGKMVCFGLRAASSLISGGSKGGSLFHFILFKIVGV